MHWAVYISVLFVCMIHQSAQLSQQCEQVEIFGESSGSRRNCHGAGSKPNRGFKLPLDVGGAPLEQTGAAGVNHRLFSCILSELSHKMVFSDQKVSYILHLTSEKWPPLFLLTSLGGEGRGLKVSAHQHQGRSSSFWVPCSQVIFQ